MPMVARHPDLGLLDATQGGLGSGVAWERVHKTRPPTPLECVGCGGPVHAKVSPAPHLMRFFAHKATPDSACPLAGESQEHRLLKVLLARAARAAGWNAELEVPGDGWRADVLAVAPDASRRVAWEAQLSGITVDEIQARTQRMAAAGVEVCWVTTRDAPWLGHVPSVRIANDADSGWILTWGVEKLDGARWVMPEEPQSVERFVALVSTGRLESHLRLRERYEFGSRNAETRGNLTWTHRTYIDAEASQERRQQQDEGRRAAEAVRHQRNIEALLERQKAITLDVVDLVFQKTGVYPECGELAPEFAMGVPVYVRGSLAALICPVASRLPQSPKTWRSTVHIYVSTAEERGRMLHYGVFANRVTVVAIGQRNSGVESTNR